MKELLVLLLLFSSESRTLLLQFRFSNLLSITCFMAKYEFVELLDERLADELVPPPVKYCVKIMQFLLKRIDRCRKMLRIYQRSICLGQSSEH
uniref:Secreted protein n=1 Tax=Romanomermis culicivorax TaxID=13658 RepID=A0A915L9N3_ROMCU